MNTIAAMQATVHGPTSHPPWHPPNHPAAFSPHHKCAAGGCAHPICSATAPVTQHRCILEHHCQHATADQARRQPRLSSCSLRQFIVYMYLDYPLLSCALHTGSQRLACTCSLSWCDRRQFRDNSPGRSSRGMPMPRLAHHWQAGDLLAEQGHEGTVHQLRAHAGQLDDYRAAVDAAGLQPSAPSRGLCCLHSAPVGSGQRLHAQIGSTAGAWAAEHSAAS
jgi:hypothetical protein